MPATNYTPIQLYRSTTSGNTPLAANMAAGEIALNIADNDMSIWMENASGTVKRFFNNPAALKYPTADGTSGQVLVTDGSGNLSFAAASGGALTDNTRQAVTSSASTTIDIANGDVIDLTMAASITSLSFTNVPASGTPILLQIIVKNDSLGTAYTIAWPSSVYWSGQYSAATISTIQTAPTLATGANGITVFALLTTNGGTNWRGWVEATIPGGQTGSLYAWGSNTSGMLGLNAASTANRSSPNQVGSLTNWKIIATGDRFVQAIKTDGTLWAWGANNFGQIGDGTIIDRSSPVQIGSATNWDSVSCGTYFAAAITTSGALWTWGQGSAGQLGRNTNTSSSSPSQVGALTDWSNVAAGNNFTLAVKTDGTLWSWGSGADSALGQSALTTLSSPKQVGALTSWATVAAGVSAGFAIRTSGTLWAWGQPNGGSLGLNSNIARNSPVQVGVASDWSRVSASSFSNATAGITTSNTLFTWGNNSAGALGLSDSVSRSEPVQVGAGSNWSKVSVGAGGSVSASSCMLAIKTDGTLWAWGANDYGNLGVNSRTSISSPVQVGASTTWLACSADRAAFAISGVIVIPG